MVSKSPCPLFKVISVVAESGTLQKGSYRGLELPNFRLRYRLSEIGFYVFFILKHCYWLSLHLLSSFVDTYELKEQCKKFATFPFPKDKLHGWCECYSAYLSTSLKKQFYLWKGSGISRRRTLFFLGFVGLIC